MTVYVVYFCCHILWISWRGILDILKWLLLQLGTCCGLAFEFLENLWFRNDFLLSLLKQNPCSIVKLKGSYIKLVPLNDRYALAGLGFHFYYFLCICQKILITYGVNHIFWKNGQQLWSFLMSYVLQSGISVIWRSFCCHKKLSCICMWFSTAK